MADDSKFSFAKLNFLSRLDARARVFVLLGSVVGVIFLVYLGTRLLSGGTGAVGPSRVASAPQGLQSVPGGQQTPEFARAIEQANLQRAKQAQMSGGSAIPTLEGVGLPSASGNPCVVCTDQQVNVKDALDAWVREGKISPEVDKALTQLADQNVPVEAYANELNRLVAAGKLTPEQARQLLATYQKQHATAQVNESASMMDSMIKGGNLPIEVANQLLDAQRKGVSPSDYSAMLQDLVRQGKITPAVAQQLLSQYLQQHSKEVVQKSIAALHEMAQRGEITPDVENQLTGLENKMVPVSDYSSVLDQMMTNGKITPAVAKKILDEYLLQKSQMSSTGVADQLLHKAEADAEAEISDLTKQGKISSDVADTLRGMMKKDMSLDEFSKAVNGLVEQNKLTPDIAKLKIDDYQSIKNFRDALAALAALQANNARPEDYANELKALVRAKKITPEEAAAMMQEYLASVNRGAAIGAAPVTANTEAYAKLQQRIQQGGRGNQQMVSANEFAETQNVNQQQAMQDERDRIQQMMSAMADQAQSLVSSWQPPTMEYKAGSPDTGNKGSNASSSSTNEASSASSSTSTGMSSNPTLIKAGTILFAALDTEVNSDYPDSPVLATIVDGKFKGAKLLGKMVVTKGVSGQMDRVSLNFTIMNEDDWMKSKTVTAYAIDPDKARTVLASNVNYHYLQKFGAIMATSFMQGYSTAITNAGTATTGIFGTSTTHPSLSPSNKIAVGLGQVGTALGNVTQNYTNIPPTVKVDSGVGLGILFMSDVS